MRKLLVTASFRSYPLKVRLGAYGSDLTAPLSHLLYRTSSHNVKRPAPTGNEPSKHLTMCISLLALRHHVGLCCLLFYELSKSNFARCQCVESLCCSTHIETPIAKKIVWTLHDLLH